MDDLLGALAQVGSLKELTRTGWLRVGVPGPESVADHSFRAAVMALMFGSRLGVDPARLLCLLVVHDLAESDPEVGDLTPFCGVDPAEKHRRERAAIDRLAARWPDGEALRALWLEYEEGATPEAAAARELDALEMAVQSYEYQRRHGIDLAEFRRSARLKIRHPRLLEVLDALG